MCLRVLEHRNVMLCNLQYIRYSSVWITSINIKCHLVFICLVTKLYIFDLRKIQNCA